MPNHMHIFLWVTLVWTPTNWINYKLWISCDRSFVHKTNYFFRQQSHKFSPSPFSSKCSLLISLKTSENLWFSDVFREIKRDHWGEKGLKIKTFLCILRGFIFKRQDIEFVFSNIKNCKGRIFCWASVCNYTIKITLKLVLWNQYF